MKIVAFDLSPFKYGATNGEASADRVEIEAPIRIEYPKWVDDVEQDPEDRAWSIIDSARNYVRLHDPDIVLIEDTRIRFGAANQGYQAHYASRGLGCMEDYCRFKKIHLQFIPIMTLKSVCLRNVKATKKDGQAYVKSKYGIYCPTDDESDACMLIDCWWIKNRDKL